jgi:hypothetical protein
MGESHRNSRAAFALLRELIAGGEMQEASAGP